MTSHAIQRTQERAVLNIKSAERLISKAVERGKSVEAFWGKEKNYLFKKEMEGKCKVLVYQSYFFILDCMGNCMTMYPAPKWFGKRKYHDGKQKIRKIKKYMRFNGMFMLENTA